MYAAMIYEDSNDRVPGRIESADVAHRLCALPGMSSRTHLVNVVAETVSRLRASAVLALMMHLACI